MATNRLIKVLIQKNSHCVKRLVLACLIICVLQTTLGNIRTWYRYHVPWMCSVCDRCTQITVCHFRLTVSAVRAMHLLILKYVIRTFSCEFSGFRRGVLETSVLLRCDTASPCHRNVENQLPSDAASCPKTTDTYIRYRTRNKHFWWLIFMFCSPCLSV